MPEQIANEDFADQVRRLSGSLDGDYAANATSSLWETGWNAVHAHLKTLRTMLWILGFLTLVSFGNGYAEAKLTAFLVHKVDEVWKPLATL